MSVRKTKNYNYGIADANLDEYRFIYPKSIKIVSCEGLTIDELEKFSQ